MSEFAQPDLAHDADELGDESPADALEIAARAKVVHQTGFQFEEALALWTEAIDLKQFPDKELAVSLSNRASALIALSRYKEALADCDKCVELAPTFAKGHLRRGHALYLLGRWMDALHAMAQARTLDPDSAQVEDAFQGVASVLKAFNKMLDDCRDGNLQDIENTVQRLGPDNLNFRFKHPQTGIDETLMDRAVQGGHAVSHK